MKCDKLNYKMIRVDGKVIGVCLATEVDAAIAELKKVAEDACLERDDNQNAIDELQAEHHKERHEYIKMIAELKQKLEDAKATAYAEMVDAGMENRRMKRALWIARAKRALEKIAWFKLWNASISTMNPEDGARQEFDKWKKNLGKFLKKSEEYK